MRELARLQSQRQGADGLSDTLLAALDRALALLGDPGRDDDAGEWAECVRLAGAVKGIYIYLEHTAPGLPRLDVAISRLTALGHTEETDSQTALAARLRDEHQRAGAGPARSTATSADSPPTTSRPLVSRLEVNRRTLCR